MKPLIALTAMKHTQNDTAIYKTNYDYVQSIRQAGGVPVLVPISDNLDEGRQALSMCSGLLIPGGGDVAPFLFHEEPHPAVKSFEQRQDFFEIDLIRYACEQKMPIFGICRGHQVINVALGGTIYQDIPDQIPGALSHYQALYIRDEPFHSISVQPGSFLADVWRRGKAQDTASRPVMVNSFHHQAVKDLAPGLRTAAVARDGVIEALESENGLVWGVQWHPEGMAARWPEMAALFTAFVELCAQFPIQPCSR